MLRLRSITECPPGTYRYVQKETGRRFQNITYPDWIEEIKKHRRANNIPIGAMFEEEIQHQLCETMPHGVCWDDDPKYQRLWALNRNLTVQNVIDGTKVMARFLVRGRKTVDQEEANRRAKICSNCQFNSREFDCPSCAMKTIHEVVESIVGNKSTHYDAGLNACRICLCSLKAKVHFPLDILQNDVDKQQDDLLPAHCWVKK